VKFQEINGGVFDMQKYFTSDLTDTGKVEYLKWKLTRQNYDDTLSIKGRITAAKQSSDDKIVGKKLFKTVFVSPTRRCIRTACIMLSNHPQKADLRIELAPLLREFMTVMNTPLSSGDDLRAFCTEVSKEYNITINADFLDAYTDQRTWCYEDLPKTNP